MPMDHGKKEKQIWDWERIEVERKIKEDSKLQKFMKGSTRPSRVGIPRVVTHHVPFKPQKEKKFIIGIIKEITTTLDETWDE